MGIEFLKYLLAAAGLQIDRKTFVQTSRFICASVKTTFSSRGRRDPRGRQSLLFPWIRCPYQEKGNIGKYDEKCLNKDK